MVHLLIVWIVVIVCLILNQSLLDVVNLRRRSVFFWQAYSQAVLGFLLQMIARKGSCSAEGCRQRCSMKVDSKTRQRENVEILFEIAFGKFPKYGFLHVFILVQTSKGVEGVELI